MKRAKLRISVPASGDILEQSGWFENQSGRTLAKRWESAVAAAFIRIANNPRSGAPCDFKAEELQGVRRMPIHKFSKHLIFYRVDADQAFILRVVHGARDLESLF